MSDDKRHEVTDWESRPFLVGIGCFFAFMLVLYAVLGTLTNDWSHGFWPQRHTPESPEATAGWINDAPQLQTDATSDLAEFKKTGQSRLHALKWNDGSHAYATIPIDRAMELYAQAEANHQAILPPVVPATPVDLQDQKSSALAPVPTNAVPASP